MTERLILTQELDGQVAQVPRNTLLPSSPAWTPPSAVPLSHGVAPPKGARGSSGPCPHFLQELGSLSLKTVCLMPNVCIREQKIVTNMHEFTDMAFGPSFFKYVFILFIDLAVLGPTCSVQDF